VARAAVVLTVAALLILPAVLAPRGGESGAASDPRDATATRICFDHGGVGLMLSDRVICADGAPHGWDGSHP
jgi:hypothetical protein